MPGVKARVPGDSSSDPCPPLNPARYPQNRGPLPQNPARHSGRVLYLRLFRGCGTLPSRIGRVPHPRKLPGTRSTLIRWTPDWSGWI
jgi:hypothetical protein